MSHHLYNEVERSEWSDATKVKSKELPIRKPALKKQFMCPVEVTCKRKQHFLKLLGKGTELLCNCTNRRANRQHKKCTSEKYIRVWKDFTDGPRFWTFIAVYLGSAILGIGPRHLMQQEPEWISQTGEKRLFYKIPGDLFRLQATHFCAHDHRSTVLFRKSIREQRQRFYGIANFSKIVYGNCRSARDPLPDFLEMKLSQGATPGKPMT